jgi:hypothetical protein
MEIGFTPATVYFIRAAQSYTSEVNTNERECLCCGNRFSSFY